MSERVLLLVALIAGVVIALLAATSRSDNLRILGFLIAAAIVWSAVVLRVTGAAGP